MTQQGGKSFWKSPWTWGIGGCCLGCVALVVIVISVAGGGVFWAFKSSGFSELKDEAVARARSSAEVVAVVGEPIETGWPRNSTLNMTNGEGQAEMMLPLSGPNGAGILHIEGTRRDGQWTFERLEFEPDKDPNVIDLLGESL